MGQLRYFFLSVGSLLLFHACMDQYNPRPYWKQFEEERQTSIRNVTRLTDKGEIPPKASHGESSESIDQRYANLCASCHGATGKGDGGAGAALNPKPRNFHDKSWQAKVTDASIVQVIKNGGSSVGLSATMPAWGSQLSDTEIEKMTQLIRAWGK